MLNAEKPWLKHWPTAVPKTIKYPSIPLHGLLEQASQSYQEKVAAVYGERELTYAELNCLSNQFANMLLTLGVEKGDRVAVYLPNIPQFVISFFGALKVGAVVTAISPMHREREVEYQLRDSGAQTIVTLDTLNPVAAKVKEKTQLRHIIITKLAEGVDFGKLLEATSMDSPNVVFNPAEDLAALQYTGGTTGTAKAAMLTHSNLVSNALQFAAMIKGTADDVFLTALPLFHIYGMTTSMTVPINLGAEMVLLPKFEPTNVFEAIQKHKVTVFCGVPTMYQYLLDSSGLAKYDLTSIRVCISGASSLPPQVQRRFIEVTGGFLAEGYGLTEASPVTHCNPFDKVMLHVGSIGLPLPDTEAKIVDCETSMKTFTIGEVGELAIKGPQIMKGYWNRPEETAFVLHDGWLLTGDIARMDSDGYFYIVDRKKDLIKHNGYSIYPRELEDILYEHPAVKLCAVVGRPDVVAGEVPKAFVVLKEGFNISAEMLKVFVNDKVASYKAINEVEFREELPISSVGKVLRRQLRERLNPA